MENYHTSVNTVFNGFGNFSVQQDKIPMNTIPVLDVMSKAQQMSIFTNLVKKSVYANLLADPRANVTVFVPSNKSFERLLMIYRDIFQYLSIDDFVAYHIAKGAVSIDDMKLRRFLVPTYLNGEQLLINGLGIAQPRIGYRLQEMTSVPTPNFEAAIIEGNFQGNNGIVHCIDQVLVAESDAF
jgi:uncharacterized surface protein with fasciclin (FAS1) repeats